MEVRGFGKNRKINKKGDVYLAVENTNRVRYNGNILLGLA